MVAAEDRVRFTTFLPRTEYDALVREANLQERSVLAEASLRLRRSLGERDGATVSGGAATVGGAASSRSPSVVPLEGVAVESAGRSGRVSGAGLATGGAKADVAPGRAAAAPSSGVCVHGLPVGVCLRPGCKGGVL